MLNLGSDRGVPAPQLNTQALSEVRLGGDRVAQLPAKNLTTPPQKSSLFTSVLNGTNLKDSHALVIALKTVSGSTKRTLNLALGVA